MSYKEEIQEMVQKIPASADPKEVEAHVTEILNTLYTKALAESKKTGHSVESITYEILEGLEEGLKGHDKEEIETILHNASETITNLIHSCAQESIFRSNKNLQVATEKLKETIAAEKAHLLESMEAFKAFAADHKHPELTQKLHETETKVKHLLKTITDKIKEHL